MVAAFLYLGAGIGALCIALAIGEGFPLAKHIAILLLLGFVAYGLSIYCYTYAQRTIGAARTSTYYALAPDDVVITNSDPFVNISNYPDIEKVYAELKKLPKLVCFNANAIAKELNARGNMVLLGAAAPYLEIEFDELEKAIKAIFGRKGDAVVETNIKAIRAGRDAK